MEPSEGVNVILDGMTLRGNLRADLELMWLAGTLDGRKKVMHVAGAMIDAIDRGDVPAFGEAARGLGALVQEMDDDLKRLGVIVGLDGVGWAAA